MFIGHFAAAYAAKRVAPRTSPGRLFFAAQFVGLPWPLLVLAGGERLALAPEDAVFPLLFERYPWSHSLPSVVTWGAVIGGLYWSIRRDRVGAVVVGALVASHWLLDLVVHLPDLPLWPGDDARLGLGLWNMPPVALAIELALLAGGVALYLSATRPERRSDSWEAWFPVAVLAAIQIANTFGPPPSSQVVVAWTAMAVWLLVLLGWWTDRERQ